MIVFIVVLVALVFTLGCMFGPDVLDMVKDRKAIGPTAPSLSNPATLLLNEYNALPKDSRPFPNIVDLLVALDEKNSLDKDTLRSHFHHFNGWAWTTTFEPSSDSLCNHKSKCKFKEYVDLHLSIKEVKDTLAAKERAELEARHVSTTEQIAELTASLKGEADHNREYVKQFKELT